MSIKFLYTYATDCHLLASTVYENDRDSNLLDLSPEMDRELSKGLTSPESFSLYLIKNGKYKRVGAFCFAPMMGCCGMVVSYHTMLNKEYHKSEISEPFRQLKTKLAKALGYSAMIATSIKTIPCSAKNMEKSGYKNVMEFNNSRTNHDLIVGIKLIGDY
jgi:hypothetical protein